MENGFLLLLLAVAIVVWGGVLLWRRPKFAPRCEACGSAEVVEVDRRTLEPRLVQPKRGGMPGGRNVRLQVEAEVTLDCKQCGHRFRQTITETH
ncbi:MAG: hypothetical protein R3C62_23455 [Chloroflexota bacterium]